MSMYDTYGNERLFDINNFEDIERRYNDTKTIAGKSAHLNIVPVHERKRKWERIEKISNDCYAIYDGNLGDPCKYDAKYIPAWHKGMTPEISLALAPIVWTRVKDGYTIRIRNGSGDYAHVSRYSFLNRAMPRNLKFVQTGNGRQYIKCGGVDYYLPKSYYMPNYRIARSGDGYKQWEGVKDDHHYLTFFHEKPNKPYPFSPPSRTYGWVPHTNTFTFTYPKTRVDKEEKAKHKANTDKFWDWICAVAPLMPVSGGSWDSPERKNYDTYNNRMADEAKDWLDENRDGSTLDTASFHVYRGYGNSLLRGDAESCAKIIKDVMADEEHPLRLPLAWAFVNYANDGYYSGDNKFASIANQDEASKLRSQYNRWINSQLNLVKQHTTSGIIVNR
jgi:hypothetical protein